MQRRRIAHDRLWCVALQHQPQDAVVHLVVHAEFLFLRKQLAFYEERQVQPRRLNDSARFSLVVWSRLCEWKAAVS